MNLVADSVEKYLSEFDICFNRNSPEMTVSQIIETSNSGNYFAHLAIHSNAAGEGSEGEIQGVEVYYYPNSQKGSMFAEIIANNMRDIYPIPENVSTKTSRSFGELRRTTSPSVLVEVAYHDNENDAEWIRSNIDAIGRALALSVKEFYEENCSCPVGMKGEVITMGGNLNIRSAPNINSPVITKVPNGTILNVTGCENRWYRVETHGTNGYAFKHYVSVI